MVERQPLTENPKSCGIAGKCTNSTPGDTFVPKALKKRACC